ncbi:MAG: efflux RND transporter permease subunit [Candidatus Eisenbacteria bacterium]
MEKVRPQLPSDVRDYQIFTFDSNDIPILVGRISSRGTDLSSSYDLLERRIINPLRRVEGVGRVVVDGIAPKDVTIYLSLDKILAHSVDVGNVFRQLQGNNVDLSVGSVRQGRQKVAVRALGQLRTMEDLENLQVNDAGVTLADISDIVYAEPAPNYYRRINGEAAVAFEIQKASGANIVEVSRRVNKVLDEIREDPGLSGVDVVLFFDQADQIKNSLRGLLSSGLIGSLLAIGILLLFLRNLRATLVVSIAIPFCVIASCTYLFLSGKSLNVLTMMGLMLAVGMLVDNAIVVLEAIHRRNERGQTGKLAARLGAREVAIAVTASTLTSVIVFAPVVFGKGELMVWLGEVGMTISITLVFSLLVCLTIVPLLAARLQKHDTKGEFAFLTRFRERYLRVLEWTAFQHPRRTVFVLVPAVVVVTILVAKITGFKPEPEDDRGFKQDAVSLELEFTDNANVYRVRDYIDRVEPFILSKEDSLGIESLYTYYQSNYAAMRLYFKRDDPTEKDIREMREYLRDHLPVIAGLNYRFGDDQGVGRGAKKVSVTLFGEDSDLLEEMADEVQRRLSLIDDVHDVKTQSEAGSDEIRVQLDRVVASRYGVNANDVAQILGLTFRGVPLRRMQGRDREIDLGIILEASDRRSVENLSEIPVSYRDERPVRLGQVSHFEFGRAPQQLYREEQKTALTITGSYEGEKFNEVLDEVRATMNGFAMPAGYSWSFGREIQQSQEGQNQMGTNLLLALFCVYLVMAALFESFLHPLVIMTCVPYALLGVVWTLMITRTPMNLFAMIGIVILIGVVVNNGIVLLDHINGLRRRGLSREEAIREGCRDRFRPILMTASTTILGLVPLSIGGAHVAGAYYYPLARAVMGGLAASTILTLVLLPNFYILAENGAQRFRQAVAWGLGRAPLPWRGDVRRA